MKQRMRTECAKLDDVVIAAAIGQWRGHRRSQEFLVVILLTLWVKYTPN